VASPIVLFWHDFADARTKKAPSAPTGGLRQAAVKQPAGKSPVRVAK
jgi:hypothetical protein